jgi:hypothetical protein
MVLVTDVVALASSADGHHYWHLLCIEWDNKMAWVQWHEQQLEGHLDLSGGAMLLGDYKWEKDEVGITMDLYIMVQKQPSAAWLEAWTEVRPGSTLCASSL